MSLKDQLFEAMKTAMKAKDILRLNTIRSVRTAVKNREIEERRELDDHEVIRVISTLVKQRRESVEMFRQSDRPELAEKEERELAVLQEFLPAPLGEEQLREIIEDAVIETGASSIKDMGKVMKVVARKTVGRADGRQVSEMVRARLSA